MSTSLDVLVEAFRLVGIKTRPVDDDDPRRLLSVRGTDNVSNGLMELFPAPIAWVHWRYSLLEQHGSYFDFAIPDERLKPYNLAHLWIDVVNPSWLSRLRGARGARWRGDDTGLGVRAALRKASQLNKSWGVLRGPEVRILAHSFPFNLWRLSAASHPYSIGMPAGMFDRWPDEWQCLTALAHQLLDTPLRPPAV